MHDGDLHAAFVRVRIASLQSEVLDKTTPNLRFVVRRRRNKVTSLSAASSTPRFAKQKVVRVVS